MDEMRIATIEKELALMANTQKTMSTSLERIAATLDNMNNFNTDLKLLEARCKTVDKETQETFNRTYERINRLESVNTKLIWLIITPLIFAVIGSYLKGAL
ncbi:MAG: hypothetical protein U9Q38_02480 [Thermodesulfobacteriota bacterium]|nr:hypothetical protein [Thermodesulfobacteriota bacterium]